MRNRLESAKQTAGVAYQELQEIGAGMAEQNRENAQVVKEHVVGATEATREFFQKPASTIKAAGASLTEKIAFVGDQLEQTAVTVKEKLCELAPASKETKAEEAAEPKKAEAPAEEAVKEPGSFGGESKVPEIFAKPTEAISKEASELNQKIMAGFEKVGSQLEGLAGPAAKSEGESKLAAFGDKIVETVVEKPAEMLGTAAEKIAASFGFVVPLGNDPEKSKPLLDGKEASGSS